jgi:hypothetical protein
MSPEITTVTDGGTVRQTIRLGNRDFDLERKKVPVDFLRLDPANQRLSYLLRKSGLSGTDEELHRMLWDQDPVKELYNSIYQNGGLIHDPIVRRNGVVVEGNCRTVCLRELHQKYPGDARWGDVHVHLLPAEVTDEQLTMLLGELHIAGRIEWRAFEQAEYVWKMNKIFGKTYDFLASHLRWSRTKLSQKIAAYEETKAYIEQSGDSEGINRFSHFEEFMKKGELRERRDQDPGFMKDFRKWVFESKFPDARDVRDLPAILENDAALEAFENGGSKAAKEVLHEKNPSLASNLWATVDRATAELMSMPLVEVEDLVKGHNSKREKLQSLQDALGRVAQHAGMVLK